MKVKMLKIEWNAVQRYCVDATTYGRINKEDQLGTQTRACTQKLRAVNQWNKSK